MRGSMTYQVINLFKESDIFLEGRSKHMAKLFAREQGISKKRNVAKVTAIYGFKTAGSYLDVWIPFARYVKAVFNIKDLEMVASAHVEAYLRHRIDTGVSFRTFALDAAALGKLCTVLNLYASKSGNGLYYSFDQALSSAKLYADSRLEKITVPRAYENPSALINAIHRENYGLAASMQHQGGPRIHEISLIQGTQMMGLCIDEVTGAKKGAFKVRGKGGLIRIILIPPSAYKDLAAIIETHGEFRFDKNTYLKVLKRASQETRQVYHGSHGLRWNFARERLGICLNNGLSENTALKQVSKEMGHRRPLITLHYLLTSVKKGF